MKARKPYFAIAFLSIIPVSLTCCGNKSNPVNIEDLLIPTFSESQRINIGCFKLCYACFCI